MDFVTNNIFDYSKVLKYIYSVQKVEDAYHRDRHLKILNTDKSVISVSTAELKNIAKHILKLDYMAYLNACTFNTYEETIIYGLIVAGLKDINLMVQYLNIYVTHIGSWAECDTIVSAMKHFHKSKDKSKFFTHFYNMCFDNREYVARFGIVVLMVHYLEDEYIDKVLTMCESVTFHPYYIDMAIAWLVSFAFMKFKDKTYALLSKHTLTPFIQNKAICKCRDSYQIDSFDKENLINYRIKKHKT